MVLSLLDPVVCESNTVEEATVSAASGPEMVAAQSTLNPTALGLST